MCRCRSSTGNTSWRGPRGCLCHVVHHYHLSAVGSPHNVVLVSSGGVRFVSNLIGVEREVAWLPVQIGSQDRGTLLLPQFEVSVRSANTPAARRPLIDIDRVDGNRTLEPDVITSDKAREELADVSCTSCDPGLSVLRHRAGRVPARSEWSRSPRRSELPGRPMHSRLGHRRRRNRVTVAVAAQLERRPLQRLCRPGVQT